jgi:hypothetical protein
MTPSHTDASTTTAQRMPEAERPAFLPRHFHTRCLDVEQACSANASGCAATTATATNRFCDPSNGGCFMAPAHGAFLLETPNGFSDKVSAESVGIIATLYALSQLSFQYPTQNRFATRFHQLRTRRIIRRPGRSSRRSTEASHGDGLCPRSHSRP